jgi:anti-sigma factor RsiW
MSTCPWPPEQWPLLLSSYLDNDLDLATRIELEAWLGSDPAAQARLDELRQLGAALGRLRSAPQVPAGWTVAAYRIGLPAQQSPRRRAIYLGLGQSLARPRALGHCRGLRKACRRRWLAVGTRLARRSGI